MRATFSINKGLLFIAVVACGDSKKNTSDMITTLETTTDASSGTIDTSSGTTGTTTSESASTTSGEITDAATSEEPPITLCENDKDELVSIHDFGDTKVWEFVMDVLDKPIDAQEVTCGELAKFLQLDLSYFEPGLQDISGLRYLANLEMLHLEDNSISDISDLSELAKLRYVDLRNNPIQKAAVVALSQMAWVKAGVLIDLRDSSANLNCNDPEVKTAFATMSSNGAEVYNDCSEQLGLCLKQQVINDVTDPVLHELFCQSKGNPDKECVLFCEDFLSVKGKDPLIIYSLDYGGVSVVDPSGLKYARKLLTLTLLQQDFSAQIPDFPELPHLWNLTLEHCKITAISHLDQFPHLKQLALNDNEISLIENLNNLSELQVISLDTNKISKISNMENLTSLQSLHLTKNKLNDIKGLSGLSNLVQLSFNSNELDAADVLDIAKMNSWLSEGDIILLDSNLYDCTNMTEKDVIDQAKLLFDAAGATVTLENTCN